jgi:hypothetical protein
MTDAARPADPRVSDRLLAMREDLCQLAAILNEAYDHEAALQCQQVLTGLAAFADQHHGNFERAFWPPITDAEGDGLQWSEED